MDSDKPISIVHKNLDQKAYQIIKKMINDRQLAPGDKISQEKLAAELGISRTPLISALKYLEKEKLVEAKPRRGFFVRAFSRVEMVSIFELREVLEGLAARRAALTITTDEIDHLRQFFKKFHSSEPITDYRAYSHEDRRFHLFVTHIAAREFLESILSSYNIISFSYQRVSSEGLVRSPQETLGEHLAIIDAICSRDPVAAETKMRQHFQRSIAHLNREIEAEASESQPRSKEAGGLMQDLTTKKSKAVSG